MAHFAKLNSENIVEQVIVVNNEVITDESGKEVEQLGIDFCKSLFGDDTNWVQCSYSGAFRGQYPALGMKYNKSKDEFVLVSKGKK